MNTRMALLLTASLAVTACGGDNNNEASIPAESETSPVEATEDMAMNHETHAMAEAPAYGAVGEATGTIRDLDSEAGYATIAHGEFSGDISMGAMTMGFQTLGGVDLSGLSEGSEVAIRVKQGRDGSYRIMAICPTHDASLDCLPSSDQ